MNQYQRITANRYRQIFVIGDLHGCCTLLMNELKAKNFDDSQDLVISVGDLIDRGPESLECLELLTQPWFAAVRGNHEQMAIDTLSEGCEGLKGSQWFHNGGNWFWSLDTDKKFLATSLIRKLQALPLVIEVELARQIAVICHADYPADSYAYGQEIDAHKAIWSRQRIADACDGFAKPIEGADLFIFGHTPVNAVSQAKNLLYIDTGAVYRGTLTLHQLQ